MTANELRRWLTAADIAEQEALARRQAAEAAESARSLVGRPRKVWEEYSRRQAEADRLAAEADRLHRERRGMVAAMVVTFGPAAVCVPVAVVNLLGLGPAAVAVLAAAWDHRGPVAVVLGMSVAALVIALETRRFRRERDRLEHDGQVLEADDQADELQGSSLEPDEITEDPRPVALELVALGPAPAATEPVGEPVAPPPPDPVALELHGLLDAFGPESAAWLETIGERLGLTARGTGAFARELGVPVVKVMRGGQHRRGLRRADVAHVLAQLERRPA